MSTDMLTAIVHEKVWRISPHAASEFMKDVETYEKQTPKPRKNEKYWMTMDNTVYLERFDNRQWILVAIKDKEDLLKYIKYKFI